MTKIGPPIRNPKNCKKWQKIAIVGGTSENAIFDRQVSMDDSATERVRAPPQLPIDPRIANLGPARTPSVAESSIETWRSKIAFSDVPPTIAIFCHFLQFFGFRIGGPNFVNFLQFFVTLCGEIFDNFVTIFCKVCVSIFLHMCKIFVRCVKFL